MTDIETIRGCHQLPGVGDCFTLEVWKLITDHSHRAKREIAQHLEKCVMPLRKPHIFQIVVLPARAHALLCRRRLVVIALFQPQKHVLELVHPRIREQQRGIPMRHQRRTPHPPVPLALKKAQEPFADLVPAPKFLATDSPVTSASVLQDSIPRLSQTQHTPAMKPESGRGPVSDCATYCELGLLYG